MTAAQREFDIVLYGATGFVGKLTAEYLARAGRRRPGRAGRAVARHAAAPSARRWATRRSPGRSDRADAASRRRWMPWPRAPGWSSPRSARTPVRPAAGGGLRGGGNRLRRSHRRGQLRPREHRPYHKQAADTGARIVHSCGFDSIPSDLTVFALYRRAQHDGAGEFGDTNFVVRGFGRRLSGGTVASMIESWRLLERPGRSRRLERPLHADPRPRRRTRTRRQPDTAVAARRATSRRNCRRAGLAAS